jgi:hypothetical protein
MHSVSIVDLHVTDNNMKMLCILQTYFYGEFISPATIKTASVFR